jgi:hypothetical protein
MATPCYQSAPRDSLICDTEAGISYVAEWHPQAQLAYVRALPLPLNRDTRQITAHTR